MSTQPKRLNGWDHVENGGRMTTEVYADGEFITITRTVKVRDRTQVAALPFAHGHELDQLIVALQRARTEHARRGGFPVFDELPDNAPNDVADQRARRGDAEATLGREA